MEGVDFGHGPGHSIIVCVRCRGRRTVDERPGIRLMSLLQALFDDNLASRFRLAEADCMAGCGRPLTVAYTAPGKASYLFGDIEPDHDASHLIDFARLYHVLPDGWCREGERPPALAGKTMARIPAILTAGTTR
jgi:predicted metal-binding protein